MTEEFRKFLKSLYDKLYKEGIITKKASTSKEKLEIVLAYIEKISKVQDKSLEKEEYLKRIKKLYYRRYIIKESEIPNSYFEFLSKRYLEEGNGHLDLINPKTDLEKKVRKMHVEEIIHTETSSIDAWLDYLMSRESDYIPTWAKVWAFIGMLDIGTINKDSGNFNRRSKETIAPFVNINSEILGKSVEYLKMRLKLIPEEYPDEEIKILASSENFYQIYGKMLAKVTNIKTNGNEGIWIKYKEKSKEDALKLYESLQGYNTGWCTASSKETAINQVCGGGSYPGGNFYVYYSLNQTGEYKIPRLAIRMNQDKIGEIRGIASSQNIESEMEEILEEKLKEFPDSNEYKKKVSDMRELTKIYEKYHNNQELTKENLRFLYEIDSKIKGFGYQKDPRIEEIIGKRNKRKDLAEVFGCTEKEIGIAPESIEGKKFVYYYGNLDLRNLTSAEGLILPESISGFLDLRNLTSAKGLTLPRNIGGSLFLDSLISSEDLTLPRNIRGSLFLDSLISSEYLTLPQSIGRSLYLRNLTIDDLLNTELPNSVLLYIFLKDGTYSLEELKNLIAIKREKLDLQARRDVIQSNPNITDDNLKRGNINIWYILIPAFTLLLGIVIASLIYY